MAWFYQISWHFWEYLCSGVSWWWEVGPPKLMECQLMWEVGPQLTLVSNFNRKMAYPIVKRGSERLHLVRILLQYCWKYFFSCLKLHNFRVVYRSEIWHLIFSKWLFFKNSLGVHDNIFRQNAGRKIYCLIYHLDGQVCIKFGTNLAKKVIPVAYIVAFQGQILHR